MRFYRIVLSAAVCGLVLLLSSGCEKEFAQGQGIRASINMYPTAESTVDPRFGLGYYYYFMSDLEKYEIDFDFVPDMGNIGDNNYMTLRGDYLHILGETTFYAGGGGGIMYETLPAVTNTYFMVEGVIGYVWLLGNQENPFPLDLRLTIQSPLGAENASLIIMGTLSYEF
ncbi:MAG: hypothetical protein JW909_03930 [Planctomycetes bacterium]|nr:hypothetical protein [Planctomycetota bacterium]